MSVTRDPRGQHRAVGAVLGLCGLGATGLGLGMTLAGIIDVGFLDGPTVMVVGGIMMITGGWQWLEGTKRYPHTDNA